MAKKLITPRLASDVQRGVFIWVPACPDMLGIIRGFLSSLTVPEAWLEIEGATIPAAEAAEIAASILQSLEDSLNE